MFCYRCEREISNAEGTCKYYGNTDFPIYESNYMQDDAVCFLVQNVSSSDPNAKEVTDSSEQNQEVSEYPMKDKTKIWKVICFIEAIALSCVTGLFVANLIMQNDNRNDMDHNNSTIEITQSEDSNITTATTAATVATATTTTTTTTSATTSAATQDATEGNIEPDYKSDFNDFLNKLDAGNDLESKLNYLTESIGQVESDEKNSSVWRYDYYEEPNSGTAFMIVKLNDNENEIEMTYTCDRNITGLKFESADGEYTYHAYIEKVDDGDGKTETCLMLFYENGQQENPEIYLLIDGNIYEIERNTSNVN